MLNVFRSFISQLFLFGIVGISLNLTSYLIFCLLIYLKISYSLAISLVYLVFFIINFFIYKEKIFQKKNHSSGTVIKYFFSHLLIYILNLFLLFLSIDIYQLSPFYSQFVIILILGLLMFYLYKYWVYK